MDLSLSRSLNKIFCLRPIKAKSAICVAEALLEIFALLGIPAILVSDNGREFRNQVINALKDMWPDMKMLARNCFDKLKAKDLTVKIKLDKQVSVREAASAIDIAGGQGFLRCNCGGNCSKLICKCKKSKVLYNPRCHQSNNNCINK